MSNIIGGEVPEHGTLKGQANILLGKDGDSAYAIACRNGFEGTEKEWLDSLNGGLITVDELLYRSGHAADAAVVGENFDKVNNAISLHNERINNLTMLPNGSTTADAELFDIRVDSEGNTHETAGEAVRAQVSSVYKNVSHLANIVGHNGDVFPHNKEKWTEGNYAYPGDADRLRSDYIVINQSKTEIEVKNNTADIRLYLELYGIDDSGEFVYTKDTSSRFGNSVFDTEGAAAIRIVIHRRDDAGVTLEDFYHASENILITQTLDIEAVIAQVSSVDKNVSHLANFAGVPGDLFDHNKENWTYGNKNYPGDHDRLRSNYIVIDRSKTKIKVNNNTADTRLYFELYSIDDSGEYVYMKDTGMRSGNTIYNTDGAAASRVVLGLRDNSDLTLDDFYHASENISITQSEKLEQKKIRVMQYNLGEFNMGRKHPDAYVNQSKISDYIAEYKKFFGEQMADILCLEEFSEFIDAADTEYPTSETIIDGIYPNQTGVSYGNTLATRHTVIKDEHIHYNNEKTDEVGCLLHTMVSEIYGREVFVCSGNLRVLATEETRKNTFNQLLSKCEEHDYVILGLDMNALSEAENRYYVETAEANGFSVANGGYFGNISTLPFSDMYPNIDNIFVKGGIVVNAYAPDVADTLASDHLPILADILLY